MTEKTTFLRNYNYDVCLAKGKIWTVEEALEYLAAHLANKENWFSREEAFQGFLDIKEQLLVAARHGIDEGSLVIDEEYHESSSSEAGASQYEIDFGKATVRPFIFISWALANNIEVPERFARYAAVKKSDKSGYYEGLGLKRSTIHHERCRAVAELLWSMEPEMTIAEMARRSEIIQFGCEGHEYDMRTISRWLASLKADRRPGQPRKKNPEAG